MGALCRPIHMFPIGNIYPPLGGRFICFACETFTQPGDRLKCFTCEPFTPPGARSIYAYTRNLRCHLYRRLAGALILLLLVSGLGIGGRAPYRQIEVGDVLVFSQAGLKFAVERPTAKLKSATFACFRCRPWIRLYRDTAELKSSTFSCFRSRTWNWR